MRVIITKIILFVGILAGSTVANSQTYSYSATTDFTDLNAGEVPYYMHHVVGALAIDASIEAYREKFARATVTFEGAAGHYDVTITALGETDGDSEFRFLINGEEVGSATNSPTTEDYSEQHHTFTDIDIPAGALLGVESIAASNGLIPEGDAFAFARGRWTHLTLDTAVFIAPEVDLRVQITSDSSTVQSGENVTYQVSVSNLSADTIATNPAVAITMPEGLTNLVSDTCSSTLICALPELATGETLDFAFIVTASGVGDQEIRAIATSDQTDSNSDNNEVITSLVIEEAIDEEVNEEEPEIIVVDPTLNEVTETTVETEVANSETIGTEPDETSGGTSNVVENPSPASPPKSGSGSMEAGFLWFLFGIVVTIALMGCKRWRILAP